VAGAQFKVPHLALELGHAFGPGDLGEFYLEFGSVREFSRLPRLFQSLALCRLLGFSCSLTLSTVPVRMQTANLRERGKVGRAIPPLTPRPPNRFGSLTVENVSELLHQHGVETDLGVQSREVHLDGQSLL
jgi:hypothetical protein